MYLNVEVRQLQAILQFLLENYLTPTFKYMVMQMRKVNFEKG